jgi:SPP1 gp7 family putative phage head morphogenesis protein
MGLPQKKLEQIFKKVHSGKIDIDSLPAELSQFTYDEIMRFVRDGFGELDTGFKEKRMASYDDNIVAFSGAKTFQQVKDLNSFVFNPDGSKRPFKEFREFAQAINAEYNTVYLKTEQDTAFGMSQGADQWANIEEDKELFPFLRYITVGDGRVRDEHAEWDGIVRPVDDSFWDTRMPPNAYRCRCTVEKVADGKKTSLKGVPKNSSEMFNVNPGKVDYIFNEKKHPYFQHTKGESEAFKKAQKWQ